MHVTRPDPVRPDCIELMVTHHCKCVSRVDHRSRNIDHLTLVIAAIDKITQEDYFARRVMIDAGLVLIPKLGQNRSQALAMPVYIANDVITYISLSRILHSISALFALGIDAESLLNTPVELTKLVLPILHTQQLR